MEQRLSLITLGVSDVSRSRSFYEQLGWRGQEVEQTVFFQAGCVVLTLWSREKLALDAGIGPVDGDSWGFSGVVLAHNVRSEGEVTEVITAAAKAGGRVTRQPQATFYGGYAGYFSDPDGHLWEVAYNPGFPLGQDGSLTLPDLGAASS
jgi:predicted lactoylglutathione lyase